MKFFKFKNKLEGLGGIMFECNSDKIEYILKQKKLKEDNLKSENYIISKKYIKLQRKKRIYNALKNKKIFNACYEIIRPVGGLIKYAPLGRKTKEWNKSPFMDTDNYFSSERIAVYSAMFGNYDKISQPITVPDNCDFYLITDQNIDVGVWKKYDLNNVSNDIMKQSNIYKNRYFKMHPFELFPDYRYSIYLDSNIRIISDITEMIYQISDYGLAFHKHSGRNCIYTEAKAIIINKRAPKEKVLEQMKYYKSKGMPERYGLIECPVIVRDRENEVCRIIMKKWWEEYLRYSTRDQLSLPYVLFTLGIKPDNISTLGDNVMLNPIIKKDSHIWGL